MRSRSFFIPRFDPLVAGYLLAIVAANLLASRFGAGVTVLNAFCFIGLDLSTRDQLHARWQGRRLWPRMLALISSGGLLAFVLGGSGRIALASGIAFAVAGIADAAVYRALDDCHWPWRVNGSNLAGAIVDSFCFPLIAFGPPVLWSVILGQFIAKIAGGALWAVLLHHNLAGARPPERGTSEQQG
jgi:queuosine precursor transporter